MTDPSFALQVAVISALAADGTVQAYLGAPARVYDDTPRHTAFPYVTLGNVTVASWDTATELGHEHTLTLNAWSRQGGQKEAKAVLAAAYDVLHTAALSLGGHRLISLRFEFADVFRDADGETVHGIARYRALTEPL